MSKRRVGSALCLLLFSGCMEDDPELESASDEQAIRNLDEINNLTFSEEDMDAGRIPKLPVSWAWYGRRSLGFAETPHTLRIRANCVRATDGQDACDPSMVVSFRDATTGAQLDVSHERDTGSTTLTTTPFSALGTYTIAKGSNLEVRVLVWTHGRGTSWVDIESSWDGGAWTSSDWLDGATGTALTSAHVTVGGTAVRVYAVEDGEVLTVNTPTNGTTAATGTRMWVFNPTIDTFYFVDGSLSRDNDPQFTFNASSWTYPGNDGFVVVATDAKMDGSTVNEQFVDLTRSIHAESAPIAMGWGGAFVNGPTSTTRPSPTVGAPVSLPGGVYSFSVFARAEAVGETTTMTRPASETGWSKCWSQTQRGRGNDLAFRVELLRNNVAVASRFVPRGVLGGAAGVVNRVSLDYVAPDDGFLASYRLRITSVGPGITVEDRFTHRRNPEQFELKVATMNIEYDSGQTHADVENAAQFLGSGPEYLGTNIRHRNDRGRWHWEADVVKFDEIRADRSEWILNRLVTTTRNQGWGMSKGFSATMAIRPNVYAPIFLNQRGTRTGANPTFSSTALAGAGCDAPNNRCHLDWVEMEWCSAAGCIGDETDFYTIPAQGAGRVITSSGSFAEKPVAVFSAYFPSSDDTYENVSERQQATDQLVATIDRLMQQQPGAFHAGADGYDPQHPGNRIVIMGDLNMRNHQCAEGNNLLRQLRAKFGYAVDVSMAYVGPVNRTADMHYSGAPLSSANAGTYGSCTDPAWARQPAGTTGTAMGCPFQFEHLDAWKTETTTRWDASTAQWYPWWNGTSSRDGGGGSRLDAIILVGQGWADDDPVLSYTVASNKENVSTPMNNFDGGKAVDIRQYCADPVITSSSATNYWPPQAICSGEPWGPGALMSRSDHKPVGVRLRMQSTR